MHPPLACQTCAVALQLPSSLSRWLPRPGLAPCWSKAQVSLTIIDSFVRDADCQYNINNRQGWSPEWAEPGFPSNVVLRKPTHILYSAVPSFLHS